MLITSTTRDARKMNIIELAIKVTKLVTLVRCKVLPLEEYHTHPVVVAWYREVRRYETKELEKQHIPIKR